MNKILQILVADEDKSDCMQFKKALSQIPIPTNVTVVNDGKELMAYLQDVTTLPDILLLDFNIPRMNGCESLLHIKKSKKLKHIPVIVFSTTLHRDVASLLYDQGAHYFIHKTGFVELKLTLHRILNTLIKNDFERPTKKNFIFSLVEA